MKTVLALVVALLPLSSAFGKEPEPLPAARRSGGMPLMEALAKRATSRAFDAKPLTAQQLADALWAALGVTRSDGKRTAPTSRDRREMEVYVLRSSGVSRYDASAHRLVPVASGDLRAVQSAQDFVHDAPVTFVYVADLSKMSDGSRAAKEATASFDTGFVSQNVYLWCVSEGLATGVRSWVDRDVLAKGMKLGPEQWIVAAQSIGWPKR